MSAPFELKRNAAGRIVFVGGGFEVEGVVPVRAFPIAAPDEGIALVAPDGHEVAWIDRLDALPPAARALVTEELGSREFMPEIQRLVLMAWMLTTFGNSAMRMIG